MEGTYSAFFEPIKDAGIKVPSQQLRGVSVHYGRNIYFSVLDYSLIIRLIKHYLQIFAITLLCYIFWIPN